MKLGRSRKLLPYVVFLAPLFLGAAAPEEEVDVSVVVILATDRNTTVDEELTCIAKEVQKKHPKLTGFHLEKVICESLPVGKKHTFKLVDEEAATVLIRHGANKQNRVGLTVKAPDQGEITYTTCCGKFFPIVTRYSTKDKERLILAIRVQPCKDDE
jgi:hypothetical protein